MRSLALNAEIDATQIDRIDRIDRDRIGRRAELEAAELEAAELEAAELEAAELEAAELDSAESRVMAVGTMRELERRYRDGLTLTEVNRALVRNERPRQRLDQR